MDLVKYLLVLIGKGLAWKQKNNLVVAELNKANALSKF